MTKSTAVGGEKTGPVFPFNLLINHANEILTGYSEAFLRGVGKALVPDYTLSMWRVEKKIKVKYAFGQKWRQEISWPVGVTLNRGGSSAALIPSEVVTFIEVLLIPGYH